MNAINWNIAEKGRNGTRSIIDCHGKIYYRDGTGEIENCAYSMGFFSESPEEVLTASHISLGANNDDLFLTTRQVNGSPQFKLKSHSGNGRIHQGYMARI